MIQPTIHLNGKFAFLCYFLLLLNVGTHPIAFMNRTDFASVSFR